MNILIVDDMERDRRMLRLMIQSIRPEDKICEASNLGHMYAELARPCNLLFLDISLNGDKEPDHQGLNALYDLIDSYPDLPICMVTGFFKENLGRFLDEFLTKTTQIVHFLDKGSYDENDLSNVFSTAQKYHSDIQKRIEDRRAADELLEEEAEKERKRIQEEVSSRLESLEIVKNAFEGHDWLSRIAAEAELTGGESKTNAALLCIELDGISKELCSSKLSGLHTFYQKAAYLTKKYNLAKTTNEFLNNIWNLRNKIIHAHITARKEDAEKLLECVQLLERLKQRE